MKTHRKQLTLALVASEFQRRNKVGCTKLSQVMQVVLTTKMHDTNKIAFIYSYDYLTVELTFRRNSGQRSSNVRY
jgi:hypothetical protein